MFPEHGCHLLFPRLLTFGCTPGNKHVNVNTSEIWTSTNIFSHSKTSPVLILNERRTGTNACPSSLAEEFVSEGLYTCAGVLWIRDRQAFTCPCLHFLPQRRCKFTAFHSLCWEQYGLYTNKKTNQTKLFYLKSQKGMEKTLFCWYLSSVQCDLTLSFHLCLQVLSLPVIKSSKLGILQTLSFVFVQREQKLWKSSTW